MNRKIDVIIAATENPEKKRVLETVWTADTVKSLDEIQLSFPEGLETGKTYEENAQIKARWVAKRVAKGSIIIADDMGMEIAGLGRKPGIHTRRWTEDPSDEGVLIKTLRMIAGFSEEERRCDFVACAVAIEARRRRWTAFERDSGVLLLEPRGRRVVGHPLASLLFLKEYGMTLAELIECESDFVPKDIRVHRALKHNILTQ